MSNNKRLVQRKRKRKKKKNNMGKVNLYILYTVLALVLIGVVMVFSASYYDALYKHKDVYFFLKKELVWVVVGICAMIFMTINDYHKWRKWTPIIYVVALALLILVLLVGEEILGAKRWLEFAGQSFQPSEVAKYAIVFSLAASIDKYGKVKKNIIGPLIYLGMAAIFAILIYLENNLSIAAVTMIVPFIIVFVSGMDGKLTCALMALGGVLGAMGTLMVDYRRRRFFGFLDPWADPTGDGFQLIHSLYALGSGGLFGVGLGNSRQKALYMPEPHNDFIFAIIGEEFGLIGCLTVIALFVILIIAGIKVALTAKDRYGKLLAIGIVSVIALQAIINIAVVSGSMPVTGVPLPFISYGGTSLVINMAAIGVLLNISRQCKNGKEVSSKASNQDENLIKVKKEGNIYSFSRF